MLQASDGREGLQLIEEAIAQRDSASQSGPAIRLVLLDFSMPTMSGPEMVARMRADDRAEIRGIPVVGVTGNALPEDVDHFLRCGAERVMLKPVTADGVRSMMQKVADRRAGELWPAPS